jgi:hypothetical protein
LCASPIPSQGKLHFPCAATAAILLRLPPKIEAHSTPFQGGEHNRI